MPNFFDGSGSLWPGADPEGRMRVCILPPVNFKNVFNVYIFSVISNLFDRNKPFALSNKACIIENVRTKCIILGEALRIKVKKFKHNLPETYSKSTKIAITASKFSKNFPGGMPLDPLRAFLVSQSASILFCRKKYA